MHRRKLQQCRFTFRMALGLLLCCVSATLGAETDGAGFAAQEAPTAAPGKGTRESRLQTITPLQIDTRYALGIVKYDLDHATQVMGWQVSDRWFFGRQKGMDSGLSLVWQQQANQVSVSKDGLRFTRRF